MKRMKQTLIGLSVMLISIYTNPWSASAQFAELVDTGTVLSDIEFKDIQGNEFSLYSVLDEGYTVVIELGLTTCSICWSFSQSGIFNSLYENYGPAGQVTPKKILPMFIECNPSTTDADLRGTGSNTQGDWVTGHDYPIVDLTSSNYRSTLTNFFPSGNLSFTTPAFLIICPDRKVVYTGTGGYGSISESIVMEYMKGRCAAAVGIDDYSNSIDVVNIALYPNPANDLLNIQMESDANRPATLSIINILGQVMQEGGLTLQGGKQVKTIETASFPSGVYFVTIQTDQGKVIRQFIKK